MSQWNYIGIDVSATTLDVALAGEAPPVTSATFPNTSMGHHRLIRWATKRGQSARVCLEATGVYSAAIALAIQRHPRLDIMVVNPKAIRNYGAGPDAASQNRSDRCPTDSGLWSTYALCLMAAPIG